ncbi:hypothetical protein GCM10025791_14110 [Halioxenophilus aromaticivorans]|uniref:Oxygenase n=1 Tax=Halioxenophilus aromaticivorans TaxID=1306992 RepID=A0AAV3U0L7_9ALTE
MVAVSVCQPAWALSSKEELAACKALLKSGLRPVAEERSERFQGKPGDDALLCRGGEQAMVGKDFPWVDWSNYWATADTSSKQDGREARTFIGEHLKPNGRGIDGALIDLEYQRIELIKFNLFDNATYRDYLIQDASGEGVVRRQWDAMRLPASDPNYQSVGGDGSQQCSGELIRGRTLSGICNDLWNPKMGATGMPFARNVQFESTFPDAYLTELTRNRHSDAENGQRIGLLKPDPQLISRTLFSRDQSQPELCNQGQGLASDPSAAHCDYQKAPFFNVLAAFWIQFMTHDWFSHMSEGRNAAETMAVGCDSDEAVAAGCRPGDVAEKSLVAEEGMPPQYHTKGETYWTRAPKTTANTVTAWWDASQIYGYDLASEQRVIRDPGDPAKLAQPEGYLPLLEACRECPSQPQWQGQESAAFPDNWSIGMSFYHNVFVREHNQFVDAFRARQRQTPDRDSGLRNPSKPNAVISYAAASDQEIYQAARLVVSAMIAKIHTIEWTPQLLYGEPLQRAMNANWDGLFDHQENRVSKVLNRILDREQNFLSRATATVAGWLGQHGQTDKANSWYSVLASGAGIFGLGNRQETGWLWWRRDAWDIANPEHVNGGVNHFGSPFNFPEEFPTVYRLHPLVPDLIEFREVGAPNTIAQKIPVIDTFRGKASAAMRELKIENWALSMGRQRLGLLHLNNHPMFLQNLPMPHLQSETGKLDIVALDIIRDRERGVPKFNEFRRQIGLRTLTSFDDFINLTLPEDSAERAQQEGVVAKLRVIYGTHLCDQSKVISVVQNDGNGKPINDCFGQPDGTRVDNIEDVDTVVGWLAEYTRPHGFAISETQFHIFILNASRRLFSDRFFTSSFRPEFYSQLGYDWVMNNGLLEDCPYPLEGDSQCLEPELSNGHKVTVSPLKRLLLRNLPELSEELMPVVNAFDPWARDRGEYYSLEWKPIAGAESDPAFN